MAGQTAGMAQPNRQTMMARGLGTGNPRAGQIQPYRPMVSPHSQTGMMGQPSSVTYDPYGMPTMGGGPANQSKGLPLPAAPQQALPTNNAMFDAYGMPIMGVGPMNQSRYGSMAERMNALNGLPQNPYAIRMRD